MFRFSRDVRSLAMLAIVFLLATGCHRAKPLYDPAPIQVSKNMSQASVGNMVKKALEKRGWSVRRLGNGKMQAQIWRSKHSAKIQVAYNSRSVDINYVDSQELNYQQGEDGPTIHHRYNNWVRHLENDIRGEVF